MAVIVSLDKHILNYRRLSVCDSRRRLYELLSKKRGCLLKLKFPYQFLCTICQDLQQHITKMAFKERLVPPITRINANGHKERAMHDMSPITFKEGLTQQPNFKFWPLK
jgi:hypothetical protein